jgi:hypothetical protein
MADMHMMLGADGKLTEVDMGPVLRRHRAGVIRHRADAIDQAADLLMDEAFTLDESYEAAEAAMPGPMVNAASYVALVLGEIERYGLLGE